MTPEELTAAAVRQTAKTSGMIDIRSYPFSAVLDGVTDCGPAIIAAMTAARDLGIKGSVYIGPGVALVGAPIQWPAGAHNVRLGGDLNFSVIRLADGVTGEDGVVTASNVDGISIAGITIDANNPQGLKRPAVTIANGSFVTIQDFKIIGMASLGLALSGVTDFRVRRGRVHKDVPSSSFNQAINVSPGAVPSTRGVVEDIYLQGSGMQVCGDLLTVRNCISHGTKYGAGIVTGGPGGGNSGQYTVMGNACQFGIGIDSDTTNVCGFELSGRRNIVSNNVARNNGGSGIVLYCDFSTVTGNQCYSNGRNFNDGPWARAGIITAWAAPDAGITGSYNLITGNHFESDEIQQYGYAETSVNVAVNRVIDNFSGSVNSVLSPTTVLRAA